ncbi:MAG: hypothetical protein QOD99_2584 [Chthoniobacter sp.]|jgi:hypothetical protein|nr:hypothetical protein [Chthoniobacter sp.]
MSCFPLARALLFLGFALNAFSVSAQWPSEQHRAYWKQGKGEITSYKLTQSRYGELHTGEAVLIFVSEPFSRSKQVKLDDWEKAGSDAVEVLKLNFTKKFLTGIYPYSLMFSAFTPADGSPTLKTSMTGQEWCGDVFGQLNLRGDHYEVSSYSYFESAGDTQGQLPAALLEDEIWARIRLTPDKLPTGESQLIAGSFISRLVHVPLKAERVRSDYFDPDPARFDAAKIRGYRVEFLSSYERALEIYFERAFPYSIVAWEDSYSEFGKGRMTTRAERTKTIMLDYWTHHKNADRKLREQLGLSTEN